LLIEEEKLQLIIEIGFTKNQAKIYLALLNLKEADGRTLSEKTKVPRPEVYRTLGELGANGLIEKEIAVPYKYKATPLAHGLKILMNKRLQQVKEIQERTNELLQKLQNDKVETPEKGHKLIQIQGKQRLLQVMKRQHDKAKRRVNILSTQQRWLQIVHFCFEDYEKSLTRGVKYRVVLDAHSNELASLKNVQTLLKNQNFDLRISRRRLKTNAAIFDQNELTINFHPSQPLSESSIIWTNHPSFISMCQDHFKTVWKASTEYYLR
jgi:sugar-specific transcriptional regulator TrmB